MEMDIKKYSWVIRGKQRRDIITFIEGPQSPTQIAQKAKYSLNHTSKVLNEFKRQGIVKLLNPQEKTGRLYTLTETGRVIKERLLEDRN